MDKKNIKIFLIQLASIMIIAFILFKWQNSIEKGTNEYTEWMNDIREDISDNVTSSIEINSLDEWNSFVNSVYEGLNYENCKVILNTDIDFKGRYIRGCIGSYENPFKGIFDGNNHTIKNINISSGTELVGLFGYTQNAVIENLMILNGNLYSNSAIATGGIAGYSENGTILNCRFDGTINIKSGDVGGIVGNNLSGLSNCKTNGTINSVYRGAGGIAGDNKGTIYHCENNISIYRKNLTSEAGGIVGYNCNLIESCVNYGNINGGGVVEWNRGIALVRECFNFGNTYAGIVSTNSDNGVIEQCVNYGKVFGRYAAGIVAFVGQSNEKDNYGNKVEGCLYLNTIWMPPIRKKSAIQGIVTNNFSIHEISANGKQKIVFMLKRKQYSKAYQYLLLKEQMTRKQRGIEILSGIIASYLVGDMVWLIPPLVRNCKNYEEAIRQKKCGNYHKALLLFEQIIKYKDSRQYGAVCLKKYIKWGINNQKNIFIGVCKKKPIEWMFIASNSGIYTFLAREGLFTECIQASDKEICEWKDTELFETLNGTWKRECFNEIEQSVICEISLMTIDEVNKYLNKEQKKCEAICSLDKALGNTKYVYWWICDNKKIKNNKMPLVTSEGLISTRGKILSFPNLAVRPVLKVILNK